MEGVDELEESEGKGGKDSSGVGEVDGDADARGGLAAIGGEDAGGFVAVEVDVTFWVICIDVECFEVGSMFVATGPLMTLWGPCDTFPP